MSPQTPSCEKNPPKCELINRIVQTAMHSWLHPTISSKKSSVDVHLTPTGPHHHQKCRPNWFSKVRQSTLNSLCTNFKTDGNHGFDNSSGKSDHFHRNTWIKFKSLLMLNKQISLLHAQKAYECLKLCCCALYYYHYCVKHWKSSKIYCSRHSQSYWIINYNAHCTDCLANPSRRIF